MNIFIVIAAYNEEKVIGRVIDDLREEDYGNIVVVDDGSMDKTSEVAEEKGAIVLEHIVNRGQGAALKTGIDYASKEGADAVITFDADGQHRPEDIKKLVKPLKEGKADIVLGSRFLGKDSKVPFFKKLVLKGGVFLIWLMYGVKLTDAHNGLRALNRKAAEAIEIKSSGMEHASEIIDEIKNKKLKYKEVPVEIRYTDYSKQKGQSSWAAIKIFFKMVLRKLVG